MSLNPLQIRSDFPIFQTWEARGEPFIYLDNAATTQRPQRVLDAVNSFYTETNGNVHRSPHRVGEEATVRFESARKNVARFVGVADESQIIFTRGTTDSINLIAGMLSLQWLKPGDVILTSASEHHSNLLPWQFAAKRSGAQLEFIPLTPEGNFDLDSLQANWPARTKVVAFQHVSNVLGSVRQIKELIELAKASGAISVIDGAQAVPHLPVDFSKLGCDFYSFSGHKMCGPTGIGVMYGRRELLERFDPLFGGGEMIRKVELRESTFNVLPYKFEPGTPNIAGAIGLGAAAEYLTTIGMESVHSYLSTLTDYALNRLGSIPHLNLLGGNVERTSAISFTIDDCHPHDIATFCDEAGVFIRAGHHCAQPLMSWLDLPATSRASFYIYNSVGEVDRLCDVLGGLRKRLGYGD